MLPADGVSAVDVSPTVRAFPNSKRVVFDGNFAREGFPTAPSRLHVAEEKTTGLNRPRAERQVSRPNRPPDDWQPRLLGRRLAHVTGRVAISNLKACPQLRVALAQAGGEGSGKRRYGRTRR